MKQFCMLVLLLQLASELWFLYFILFQKYGKMTIIKQNKILRFYYFILLHKTSNDSLFLILLNLHALPSLKFPIMLLLLAYINPFTNSFSIYLWVPTVHQVPCQGWEEYLEGGPCPHRACNTAEAWKVSHGGGTMFKGSLERGRRCLEDGHTLSL